MPKTYDAALGLTDREKKITVEEALNLVGKTGFAKFDESVDIAVRLGVNPKHADQMVRGACVMPSGTGKPYWYVERTRTSRRCAEADDASGEGASSRVCPAVVIESVRRNAQSAKSPISQ